MVWSLHTAINNPIRVAQAWKALVWLKPFKDQDSAAKPRSHRDKEQSQFSLSISDGLVFNSFL